MIYLEILYGISGSGCSTWPAAGPQTDQEQHMQLKYNSENENPFQQQPTVGASPGPGPSLGQDKLVMAWSSPLCPDCSAT